MGKRKSGGRGIARTAVVMASACVLGWLGATGAGGMAGAGAGSEAAGASPAAVPWAAALLGSPPVWAAETTPAQQVDAALRAWVEEGAFSGSVLLAKHGVVMVDRGYGAADSVSGRQNQPSTRFAIGRLTQGFMAAAVMLLKDEGKLSLSDSIGKFLPDTDAQAGRITVGMLVTHTSGAPSGPDMPAALPGTLYRYSPLNYVVLAQVIEAVSGESAQAYIQQNILNPLGLRDTGFIPASLSAIPGSATGNTLSNGRWQAIDFSPGVLAEAYDMYSTVEDLYRWQEALVTGHVLGVSDVPQLFWPTSLSIQALKTYGYGLGWEVSPDGTRAQEGSIVPGFSGLLYRDLGEDETLIILANRDAVPMDDIAGALLGILRRAPLSVPALTSRVGGQKQVVLDGRVLSRPYSRVADGTTHMPIWYIGKALEAMGIAQTWDGNRHAWHLTLPKGMTADFSGMAPGTGNTDLFVNGVLVKRINTYAWPDPAGGGDTTYVPIYYLQQILAAAGVHNTWDGQAWQASRG
ncbi:serine hydrolase domain-containing protein [Alicyclobacillus sp.]|uniref:serine hydrolase domain-containing protein n=1 Tax=Alicyclobacillus sp. TaxID=61169 RepID=UPI0025BCFDE5|nr:serine hydrolase domain-containing protein [Alicyclobacillus sp.]MCL6518193.1 beta-lactamase family protein [Alicyclobacillus sp.]